MQIIDIEYLRRCFLYSPMDGKIFWLERPESHFSSARYMKAFNSQFSGIEAGVERFKPGNLSAYRSLSLTVNGRRKIIECHRIAFAIYHGFWPQNVDHFDGDTLNNSISNLRPVTRSGNGRNKFLSRHNTSGIPGVSRSGSGWVVHGAGKPKLYIGWFSDIFSAACARKRYEISNNYTPRHGSKRP